MTDDEAPATSRKRRGRSPSYPGIDLQQALRRSHKLYEHETRHAAPVAVILQHWGYKPNSGGGLVALAALKKFGLLVDEGSGKQRKARLSSAAVAIAVDTRPETGERLKALQLAALTPSIHRELWDEYAGVLPSDTTLRFKLVTEKNFTESGADEFILQFKRTLAFAKLGEGDMLSGDDKDKPPPEGEAEMTPPTEFKEEAPAPSTVQQTTGAVVIQLPVAPSEWAALRANFPLTPEKWQQMLDVLEAMKPSLVEDGSEDQSSG